MAFNKDGNRIPFASRCGYLTLQAAHLRSVLELGPASDSENRPERGMAAGTLRFAGRVPRCPRCHKENRVSAFKRII